MGLRFGSTQPGAFRLGSIAPSAAYLGAIPVWFAGPPPVPTFTVTPLLNQTVEVSWDAVPGANTLTLKMSRVSSSGYGTYTATTLDPTVSGSIVVSDLSFVPNGGTVWPAFEPHWTIMEATNALGTTSSGPYGVPMISSTVTGQGDAEYDPNSKSWFYTDDYDDEWSSMKTTGEANPNVQLAWADNIDEINFITYFVTKYPHFSGGRWIALTDETGSLKWAGRGNSNLKDVSVTNWAANEPQYRGPDYRAYVLDNSGVNLGLTDSQGKWIIRKKQNFFGAVYRIPAPALFDAQYLVIAGGGGGGKKSSRGGGGGGAGGYRSNVPGEYTGGGLPAEEPLYAATGESYTITVGVGGVPAPDTFSSATRGTDSIFSTITAIGGGAGSGSQAGDDARCGGGSGGGSASSGLVVPYLGTAGQGFDGGLGGPNAGQWAGGGGGGAGAPGGNMTGTPAGVDGAPSHTSKGGDGGDGVASSITGTSVFRAAGGGGGGYIFGGLGGAGGGGNASPGSSGFATPAVANTGSGGGGTYQTTASEGADGVVILSIPEEFKATFSGGVVQTLTTSGGRRIYTITQAYGSETVTFDHAVPFDWQAIYDDTNSYFEDNGVSIGLLPSNMTWLAMSNSNLYVSNKSSTWTPTSPNLYVFAAIGPGSKFYWGWTYGGAFTGSTPATGPTGLGGTVYDGGMQELIQVKYALTEDPGSTPI